MGCQINCYASFPTIYFPCRVTESLEIQDGPTERLRSALNSYDTVHVFVLLVDDVIFSLCAGSRRDYECLLSFHKHTYVINIDWNISHFHTSRICILTS